jgi:hypothetical protein
MKENARRENRNPLHRIPDVIELNTEDADASIQRADFSADSNWSRNTHDSNEGKKKETLD